jgi:hypothetical protein
MSLRAKKAGLLALTQTGTSIYSANNVGKSGEETGQHAVSATTKVTGNALCGVPITQTKQEPSSSGNVTGVTRRKRSIRFLQIN